MPLAVRPGAETRAAASRLLLAFLLPLLTAGPLSGAEVAPAPFTLKPLGHGVYAAVDIDGKAGANAGFVIGDDGVAVIDTFQKPAAAEALLAAIRAQTELPVRFVINTHYHIDHVAGNRLFHDQGAVIVAQRNVRSWIHTENLKFFGKEISAEKRTAVEDLYAPDLVYDQRLHLYLGSREILVESYPGHTGGDSVVVVPAAGVVFCGDLFWHQTLPNLIDATVNAWIDTLDVLRQLPDASSRTYVPGHGEVGSAEDLGRFRNYLSDLHALVEGPAKEGGDEDALVHKVMPTLEARYGTWAFFKYFARPDILHMAAEIRGTKTVPVPLPAID